MDEMDSLEEQRVALMNTGPFKELIKVISENRDIITKLSIDDNNIYVETAGKRLFEHTVEPGLSINEQLFLLESIKEYFYSGYTVHTNLYKDILKMGAPITTIEKGV